MDVRTALEHALAEAGFASTIAATRNLSGGCIHQVLEIELASGEHIVAKVNDARLLHLFEEESRGLSALAQTQTVVVPRPLVVTCASDHALLLMTAIEPSAPLVPARNDEAWRTFGRELAALHACDAGTRYGFDGDNHIGSTPQPNGWSDDWVEFNREHRLGYQVRLARQSGHLSHDEAAQIERAIDRLDAILPRRPKPSLLHGDLWSGNAIASLARDGAGATYAVIDPACSIGDALADIAMMQLFGGFAPAGFAAYEEASGVRLDSADSQRRIAVYQLYHVLNHVNIFGRGYVAQALSLARGLV